MGKRLPRHPLEKWANMATEFIPIMNMSRAETALYISLQTILEDTTMNDDETVGRVARILATATYAADLIRGNAQIIRITDELYNDVIESKMHSNDETDLKWPWPSFAIELKQENYQALIAIKHAYMFENVQNTQHALKLKTDVITRMLHIIRELAHSEGCSLTLVPNEKTMLAEAKNFAHLSKVAMSNKTLRPEDMSPNDYEQLINKSIEKMPFDIWTPDNVKKPKSSYLKNLVEFVLADNVERRVLYSPPPTTTNNPKKHNRSKATIHEVGFAWSDAYKQYKQATKSTTELGGHVRPHTRRGHFHRFRIGPRDGDVQYITHWIPPMLVGRATDIKPSNQGHVYRKPRKA